MSKLSCVSSRTLIMTGLLLPVFCLTVGASPAYADAPQDLTNDGLASAADTAGQALDNVMIVVRQGLDGVPGCC